ncbi:MAG: hypothetical protein LBS96_06095 [Oscillospiraceae bacterium]|jgi:phosphopantothenate-cysteine ligase|nr:hypothetical protein [Oscillospiraceae bacterium]
MTVLITAGGTVESIDRVRGITNFATGRLGSLLADRFALAGHRVLYVHGRQAALPQTPGIEAHAISSVRSLQEKLRALCNENTVDWVLHSMAVSDYAVEYVTDAQGNILTGEKISSAHEKLLVHLRQTPKVIAEIQQIAPQAKLIGFKLRSGVTRDELLAAAQTLLQSNRCTYVLANLLEETDADRHHAWLVEEGGVLAEYQTKAEIAEGIVQLCQTFCSA